MAIRKVEVNSLIEPEFRQHGQKTLVREKILLGVYGGVSKIPATYRNKVVVNNLPPTKGKVQQLVPLEEKSWTTKDKIKFRDENGEKFCKDLPVNKVQDVVLAWSAGARPAMMTLEIFIDEERIGELRLYAGVLVHIDDAVKQFVQREGYENMVYFTRKYPYTKNAYRFQLLTFA